jgi:hypothetical protein
VKATIGEIIITYAYTGAASVAQWLEQRREDLMILTSLVRIRLWDVGAGPSDETV